MSIAEDPLLTTEASSEMKTETASFAESPNGDVKTEVFLYDRDSSSDSEEEIYLTTPAPAKKKHLFGREEPLHDALGGGRAADIVLWRDKKISASIFASVTAIWVLVEWMGFHALPLLCHSLIIALTLLFVWSNASSLIKRRPPKISDEVFSEDIFLKLARVASHQINQGFITFQYVASGKDVKQFILVVAVLWFLSIVGRWFDMLTLIYMVFVTLYVAPVIYEKYEDQVDSTTEKIMGYIQKQCEVLETKVFSKMPSLCLSRKQI